MFRKFIYAGFAAFGLSVTPAANAQVISFGISFPSHGHYHRYHVQYRSPLWQERTFHDRFSAREFAYSLESRGYEVDVSPHRAHLHVRYRMPYWETYTTVYSHSEAHRVERMLEFRGYETRVVHR